MKLSIFKTRTFWTGLVLILSSLYFAYLSLQTGDQVQLTIAIGNLLTGIGLVFGRSALVENASGILEVKQILEDIKSGKQPNEKDIEKIVNKLVEEEKEQ